jgi:hypothetical protein
MNIKFNNKPLDFELQILHKLIKQAKEHSLKGQ